MPARVIAFFNQAGGVGKTTLTMNIGYHLGELGKKVLLVDMDPQASLTTFMGIDPDATEKTICHALVDETGLPICYNVHGVDLTPTNENLSGAEKMLTEVILKEMILKQTLEPVRNEYDLILLDCPPSLGFLSIISLLAATDLLIPIETEYKALEGTKQLVKTIERVRKHGNPTLHIAGVVPTIYNARLTQERGNLDAIKSIFARATVFDPIPDRTDFANASQAHLPLALYAPSNPALRPLQAIARALGAG